MVEVVYEEITCPTCQGEGWVPGRPHPRQPFLVELVRCAKCGGAGALRQGLLVEVEDLALAA
jgi:DnaJ-class molecular chaperone